MQVIGIDISPHMLPDDYPDNFEPQASQYSPPLPLCPCRLCPDAPAKRAYLNHWSGRSFLNATSCRRQSTDRGQLDDLNQPFTFPSDIFDLVQSRLVAGGINSARWPTYVKDIARYGQIHQLPRRKVLELMDM